MLAASPSCRSFRVLLRVAGQIHLGRVAWLLVMLAVSRTSVAQVIPPITTALPNAEVWVHPIDGVDPVSPDEEEVYVNDPSLKFKTLQAAIDALQRHLAARYVVPYNLHQQGIVHALPGLYGPFGASVSSHDSLPIRMRERVHVQGASARSCVIRGASTVTAGVTNMGDVFFPTQPFVTTQPREVLVTYHESSPLELVPALGGAPAQFAPWLPEAPHVDAYNTAETFDGFTLIGGDVQVLLRAGGGTQPLYFPACRISNCVFDLRHDWKPEAPVDPLLSNTAGPYFGVLMTRRATCYTPVTTTLGYLDGRVLIAHNTFVFARWNGTEAGWDSRSRPETVGILDVTNPACSTTPCTDPDGALRGVGNPCIAANLFRTKPETDSQVAWPMAMVGIERRDTLVFDGTSFVQTNMFDPARVGATNAGMPGSGFFSTPVASVLVESGAQNGTSDLWNCRVAASADCGSGSSASCAPSLLPVPKDGLALWDGASGLDPAFVGEYVAVELRGAHPSLAQYRDWRVLPGSPVENGGVVPPARRFVTLAGTYEFATNEPAELDLFKWDGERWGNPRVVGGAPDVGFDERHLMIEVGNWANESNSHNVPGFMNPVGHGVSMRYFVLPTEAGGVQLSVANRWLRLHDTTVDPPAPSSGDGWVTPPGALLNPPSLASLPKDYRAKYVSYASIPKAPISTTGATADWAPLGQSLLALSFLRVEWDDPECITGCQHSYFNLQGLIVDDNAIPSGGALPGELLRGNMQGEYR